MHKLHTQLKQFLGFSALLLLLSFQVNAQNATIGDYVWFDGNSNGIQDDGDDAAMEGVFVILQDAGGVDLDFYITGDDGAYSFSVAPGSYRLKFANPGGVTPSPENNTDEDNDSDQDLLGFTEVFTVGAFETIDNIDGGFMPIPPPCTLDVDLVDVDCDFEAGTFTVTLSIEGGGPWGFNGGGLTMAFYGTYTFGPFNLSDGEVCLSFVDFDNPTCTGEICVDPDDECEPCVNVTDGGIIAGNEIGCGPYNPGPITNVELPSGGEGELEYMWLASKSGCPEEINVSMRIFGADGPTYDPPAIYQTMYYIRWSRRVGCTTWIQGRSNCIVKAVVNDGQGCEDSPICESRMVMDAQVCDGPDNHALTIPHLLLGISNPSDHWYIVEGQMTEFTNGNAKLLARLRNVSQADVFFDLDLNLSERTFHRHGDSPVDSDCYGVYTSDWYYYKSASGTLEGNGPIAGGRLAISSIGESIQIGTGANLHDDDNFGISGDFEYTVVSQPTETEQVAFYLDSYAHMGAELTGGVSNCIPDASCCYNNKILYVVGDEDFNQSDEAVIKLLEDYGYEVSTQLDYEAQPWDAMGYGVVLISATVNSELLDGTFRDVHVPVICNEAWVFDDMGMTGPGIQDSYGSEVNYRVNITDDSHPTSAGRHGVHKVYNIPRQMSWGISAGDAADVAHPMFSPGKDAIFAYETGDYMYDLEAPARRVGFFVGPQAGKYLSREGKNLLLAAVAWAIDCDLTTETFPGLGIQIGDVEVDEDVFDTEKFEVNLFPNPTSGDVNIDVTGAEDQDVFITIYDSTWKAVKEVKLTQGWGGRINLNLNNLTTGLHFVQVVAPTTGQSGVSKLVVQK